VSVHWSIGHLPMNIKLLTWALCRLCNLIYDIVNYNPVQCFLTGQKVGLRVTCVLKDFNSNCEQDTLLHWIKFSNNNRAQQTVEVEIKECIGLLTFQKVSNFLNHHKVNLIQQKTYTNEPFCFT